MSTQILKRETVYQGRALNVRCDQVRLPHGGITTFDVVDHPDSVALIPVDEHGRLWFVRQYRHPPGKSILEIPAGTLRPGEDPGHCAVRECREEVGMSPGRLLHLGSGYLAPGYSTEFMHFYLALDLTPAPLAPDADEILKAEPLTQAECWDRIRDGSLRDVKSLAGLLLALEHLPGV